MRVFKIENNSLTSYKEEDFKIDNTEKILEDWIENTPNAIFENEEVFIIGRQVTTDLGKAIDLLGLDKNGNTVVINKEQRLVIVGQYISKEIENTSMFLNKKGLIFIA